MFKPVSYSQGSKGRMLMAYGPPGTGKSTFAARLCKEVEKNGSRAVYIDFELGVHDALQRTKCEKVELYDLSDPEAKTGIELPNFLRSLRQRKEVKLVVLDTLSEMAWSLLRGICGTKSPSIQMYGERKRQLKEILLELRNLTKTGKHVLVLTHQAIGEVEGLPGYYAPECPKRDRPDIVGQFDLVGRLMVANKPAAQALKCEVGTRYMDLTPDPQFVSKVRFFPEGAASRINLNNLHDVQEFIKLL